MNNVLKYTIIIIVLFGIYTSPGLGYLGARMSVSYLEDSASYSKNAETILNRIINDISACQDTSNTDIPSSNSKKSRKNQDFVLIPLLILAENHISGKILLIISLIFMVFIQKTRIKHRQILKICSFQVKYLKWLFRFLTPLAKCIKTRVKQTDGDFIKGISRAFALSKSPHCDLKGIIVRAFSMGNYGEMYLIKGSQLSTCPFNYEVRVPLIMSDKRLNYETA